MIEKITAKKYLEISVKELLSSTDVDMVTVKSICRNCGLSTRTFYKYYRDKFDVINSCFNSELELYYDQYQGDIRIGTFLWFTARIVNEHVDFYKNVFKYTGQNNIRMYLVKPLSEHYIRIIRDYCGAVITKHVENAVIIYIQGQLAFVEEGLQRTIIPDASASVSFFEDGIPAILAPYL